MNSIYQNKDLPSFMIQSLQEAYYRYPIVTHPLLLNIVNNAYAMDELQWIVQNFYYVFKKYPKALAGLATHLDDFSFVEKIIVAYKKKSRLVNFYTKSLNAWIENFDLNNKHHEPSTGTLAYVRHIMDSCLNYTYYEGIGMLIAHGFIFDQIIPLVSTFLPKQRKIFSFLDFVLLQNIENLVKKMHKSEKKLSQGIHLGMYYLSVFLDDLMQPEAYIEDTTHLAKKNLFNIAVTQLKNSQKYYPLAEGKDAVDRLSILNSLYNEQSIHILKKYINAQTQSILEIGCGTGVLSYQLACTLPNTIHILATDFSEAQIAICKKNYANISNLKFGLYDCNADKALPNKFDVIFVRFLLIFQKDIAKIIQNMLSMLKEGGYLLIEEFNPISTGCYAYGQQHIVKRWNIFWKLALMKTGRAKDLERNIFEILSQNNVQKIEKKISHGVLTTKKEKSLFYLCMEEAKPYMLSLGITSDAIDDMCNDLKKICDNNYPVNFARNFQIIAQK